MTRDRTSWALLALTAAMCGLNVGLGTNLATRLSSVIALAICAVAYATHRTLTHTRPPQVNGSVVFERDQDGHVRAFVTENGEPSIVDVPDEISELGPHATLRWLLNR